MIRLFDFPSVEVQPNKSNEWYTPSLYVEAARKVMGGSIDLDPASCEMANRTVKAKKIYTIEDNGLVQQWHGNVWLNPPFSRDMSLPNERRSNIAKWTSMLIHGYQSGDIVQSVLLATAQIGAAWFNPLWNYPICFTDHTVRFFLPHGSVKKGREGASTDGHLFGTVFVYLGPNEQKFIDTFSQFGTIAKRVSTPKSVAASLSLWEVE
jgi:DNA N-6-adenine-methyltransferase (Dam)